MLDIHEINDTISHLEQENTSFRTCEKLAYLYIVRDHFGHGDKLMQEYSDILPSYNAYCEAKSEYQRGKISKEMLHKRVKTMCSEICEFLNMLMHNTDTYEERELIYQALRQSLQTMKQNIDSGLE